MSKSVKIAAVVLAAGRSSRMGSHKLLLPLGGHPLVTYAVRAATDSAASPIVVVLGHNAERVRRVLPVGAYRTIVNERYGEGMATSLNVGIAAIDEPVTGAVVLLADQPLLSGRVLDRVLAEAGAHPERIVAATYGGTRGHPVFFPVSLFPEIQAIQGDEGARSVLARHADLVTRIAIEPPWVGLDVDEPSVYERLVADWPRYSAALAL